MLLAKKVTTAPSQPPALSLQKQAQERFDLVEAFLYLPQIEQLVFSKDHDVLHFRHDVHVNAAVMIFTGGGQALSVFNGGQHNGI